MRRLAGMMVIGLVCCVLAWVVQGEGVPDVKLTDQVVEGFAEVVSFANGGQEYDTCREERRLCWWEYTGGGQAVEWKTAPVPKIYSSGEVRFVWSCGMTTIDGITASHDLYLNGARVITFATPVQDTVHQRDRLWEEGEYALFYDYVRANGYGDSFGVMHLTVPASAVSPGEAAVLKVEGAPDHTLSFFMLSDYTDTAAWLQREHDGDPVPGSGEVTDAMIASLKTELRDEDEEVRLAAAGDLVRLGEQDAILVLNHLLANGSVETRRAAAADLELARDRSSAGFLVKALEDEDAKVRLTALSALGKAGGPILAPILTKVLQGDDREMRVAAATVLTTVSDASAVPALMQALKDEDREIRMLVVRALSKTPDPSMLPALTAALKDEYAWVRDAAIYALGEIGDRSAVPALIETLGDEDEFVQQAAGAALCTITGRTWAGTDREAWRVWWEKEK